MRKLRILFATTRGTGHLSPLLPYAKELSRRGHKIRIAARIDLADRIKRAGFEHVILDAPKAEELEEIWARTKGLTPNKVTEINIQEIFGGITARAALPAMKKAISDWRPDLIVRESLEFSSIVAAQAAGIPHSRIEVSSAHSEESYFPAGSAAIDLLRISVGLNADAGDGFLKEPVFSAFPKALDGSVVRRGSPTFRVGPSVADNANAASNAPWAQDNGDPLIYLTFGTETQKFDHAKSIHHIALEAVTGLPVRALLTTGAELAPEVLGAIPPNATVLPWVPQSDVFPLATVLVNHGGSGSMLGGLAAGLPMVITPLFADQPSNADQVEKAGAGLAVPDPSPETLRSAITEVLEGQQFREGASRIAVEMAQTPKIDAAVDKLLEPVAG